MREEFNIDGSWSLTSDLLKKYPNEVFVETGTFKGGGIRAAWEAGFSKIFSIEKDEALYRNLVEHFENVKEVILYNGDSENLLQVVLESINEPATIFLDAHSREYETAQPVPLMKELQAIKNHRINTHTILIDDIFCAKDNSAGWEHAQLDSLIMKLLEINEDYMFLYEDGKYIPDSILVARLANDTSL